MKRAAFDESELNGFRNAQRLAYACAEAVAAQLTPGMTEVEAARRMRDWFAERGVRTFFHKPFAWFGDRSALRGMTTDLAFFPTQRRLSVGMPVILDVAPIVSGYMADIGFATALGENTVQRQMRADLLQCRQQILAGVRAQKSFRRIYRELDDWIEDNGYENAHRVYPRRVLAHRVVKLSPERVSQRHLFGFGLDQFRWLVPETARALLAPRGSDSPLWNDGPESDHSPRPGLWAVEPHLARGAVGAKWEELLVITEHEAYWLDDDVPHVRSAARAPALQTEVRS